MRAMSGVVPRLPQLLGVVGAGQMGAGIAQVAAAKGLDVILTDANQTALDRGLASIHRSLARQVQKGHVTQDQADLTAQRVVTAHALKVRCCWCGYRPTNIGKQRLPKASVLVGAGKV